MTLRHLILVAVLAGAPALADAPATTGAAQQVVALLREFIAGAGGGDPALYDRFFADDVLYTRSTGAFTTKSMIMESVRAPAPASEPSMSYGIEDLTVHPFGDTVVVAFRLVAHAAHDGKTETLKFRDTGTFLRRNGRWQVVAWQATRIEDAPPAK